MAKFEIHTDQLTGDIMFSGSISDYDLRNMKLGRVEIAMIKEPPQTASDILLDLETIYRRIEEQLKEEK